ncbi:GNAT family N-acetyltransferase [Flavobacterium sp.]|uniref:GNAT family N-acetyltransferase n=1 Tax=Flavobacterium sp. TaxID=239 RepID=UPI002869F553|nr:GNAT family N-acetyltransferase [Flavobacterium sp.]
MITTIRTQSDHADFQKLVKALDIELQLRDGAEHGFYAQFNSIATIKHVVVAYHENEAVGCGAFKAYDDETMEIKRMYVKPEQRGKGIASIVLKDLEKWVDELNYKKCLLETGIRQPEAIALYTKNQYQIIPNFGQYEGVADSVCFEKRIDTK